MKISWPYESIEFAIFNSLDCYGWVVETFDVNGDDWECAKEALVMEYYEVMK